MSIWESCNRKRKLKSAPSAAEYLGAAAGNSGNFMAVLIFLSAVLQGMFKQQVRNVSRNASLRRMHRLIT